MDRKAIVSNNLGKGTMEVLDSNGFRFRGGNGVCLLCDEGRVMIAETKHWLMAEHRGIVATETGSELVAE
ncbi:hypothetical protein VNO78_07335 [Psophocarpus tetragonolobus]|uniref:Uncharacterized protein n=1 Tax=Psophocarpus tetragonolobus TaxID=3891 RepID=A0AAN9XRL0_PSOTE